MTRCLVVALQIAFASNLAYEQATSNLAHTDIKRRRLRNNKTFDVNPRISFCKQVNIGKKKSPLSLYDSSMPITIV